MPCSAERASAIGGRSAARSSPRWSGTTPMMSAVSAVPMGMLSAATCDELSSIHTCSCCQSCAWRVIFGSTARRSRRRSPAGRRRRRRPRGMRIRCVRSRCARCTSGAAHRVIRMTFLASASDAPRARTAAPISTKPGGASVSCVLRIQRARYERLGLPERPTRPKIWRHDQRSKWWELTSRFARRSAAFAHLS